jgi:DNA polymerase III gamma/tau subunit
VEFLRKLLIAKIDTDYLNTTDLSDEHKKQTRKILEGLEVKKIIEMIDLTIKRKNEIRNSPVPQLPMEMLAVELAGEIIGEPKETTPEIKIEEKIATPKKEPSEENTEPIETIIEVEAEPICSPKNEATSSGKIFSLSEVNDKWAGFLKEMTEVCPSLVFILNMAELKSMEKNCLEIGVQYSFHKEKLEQSQNFSIITQCLKKVFGENIRYKTVVEKKDNNQELTDLAMDFGGEVI